MHFRPRSPKNRSRKADRGETNVSDEVTLVLLVYAFNNFDRKSKQGFFFLSQRKLNSMKYLHDIQLDLHIETSSVCWCMTTVNGSIVMLETQVNFIALTYGTM